MGKISLLDCTLRDGGYINDWHFGYENIKGILKKLQKTGIEIVEAGFIKGDSYDKERAVFPDTESFRGVLPEKNGKTMFVGMADMSAPIPMERITPRTPDGLDGIRVIFKKEKMDLAYQYCEHVQKMGYFLSVNFVGTDLYTDQEFIAGIEKFNQLNPNAVSIVDSFGLIKRKQFLRLCYLADNNLAPGITLAYHAHNNLQQAFGNAEALVEMNFQRDLIIDACVFGMGRGAGNLNLELFAEYMNENYGTHYQIEPMLEIMDEYLNEIYRTKFWGYSLPLYLSASNHCHPNYAVYLGEKNTLTVKAFSELLQSIPEGDKAKFSKEKAEKYYRAYQESYVDDKEAVQRLGEELKGKQVLILAPGYTLRSHAEEVRAFIKGEAGKAGKGGKVTVIAANFTADEFSPDYVFSSNMRRFAKMQGKTTARCIVTSNMKECTQKDFVVNFASYASRKEEIMDNSVLMLLRLLLAAGVREVALAGMDGYSEYPGNHYVEEQLEHDFSQEAKRRNQLISEELEEIRRQIKLIFLTPTSYLI